LGNQQDPKSKELNTKGDDHNRESNKNVRIKCLAVLFKAKPPGGGQVFFNQFLKKAHFAHAGCLYSECIDSNTKITGFDDCQEDIHNMAFIIGILKKNFPNINLEPDKIFKEIFHLPGQGEAGVIITIIE